MVKRAALRAGGQSGTVRRPDEDIRTVVVAAEDREGFTILRVPEAYKAVFAAGSQDPVGRPGDVPHPIGIARKDQAGRAGGAVPQAHHGVVAVAGRGDGLAVRRPGHGERPALARGRENGPGRLLVVAPHSERAVITAGRQPLAVRRPRHRGDGLGVSLANRRPPFPFGSLSTRRRTRRRLPRRGRRFPPTTPCRGYRPLLQSALRLVGRDVPEKHFVSDGRRPAACRRATRPGRGRRGPASVPAAPWPGPKGEPFCPRKPWPASGRRATRRRP